MKQITSDPLLVLVIGVDEFNNLHNFNEKACKNLILTIGSKMCKSPPNIFFIPILSGTIEGALGFFFTGSMHKPLRLPLRLLELNDSTL